LFTDSRASVDNGRHQCVGQQLARMELQIVLRTLLRRIPTYELAVGW
jgi:cytochrome P450